MIPPKLASFFRYARGGVLTRTNSHLITVEAADVDTKYQVLGVVLPNAAQVAAIDPSWHLVKLRENDGTQFGRLWGHYSQGRDVAEVWINIVKQRVIPVWVWDTYADRTFNKYNQE